jgi:hypothetical protein
MLQLVQLPKIARLVRDELVLQEYIRHSRGRRRYGDVCRVTLKSKDSWRLAILQEEGQVQSGG